MTTPPAATGNLADLVRDAAARFGDRTALIGAFGSKTWTELDTAIDTAAADLLESGVHRGDRVLLALPSSADLALSLLAVARAGLVAVPIDPAVAGPQLVAGRVQAAIAIATEPVGVEHEFGSADLETWWSRSRAPVAAIGAGEDLAQLARASRSDRAVMIPHRAVLAAVAAISATPRFDLRADDRALMSLPLYHLAGFVTGFLPLASAGAAAVFPGPGAGAWVTAVREHRVTILPGSPTVYREVLQTDGAERALASVRLMTSSAASLLAEDFAAMRSLTGQDVWEGYGISEATSVVASSLMTTKARAGSVGLAAPGLEIRIGWDGDDGGHDGDGDGGGERAADHADPVEVAESAEVAADNDRSDRDVGGAEHGGDGHSSEEHGESGTGHDELDGDSTTGSADDELTAAEEIDGNLLDIGSVGEVGPIEVRGPTLFLGYWPDAGDGPGEDGWYTTADLGYIDDAGELRLVDRSVDTFTVSGFTVYPREIERVLAEHPAVLESAVIGVPGATGNTIVAVVTPRPGLAPNDEELAEFVVGKLPEFKQPQVFRLVGSLPRTELGRIDRSAVLAAHAAAFAADPASLRPVVAVPSAGDDETVAGGPDDAAGKGKAGKPDNEGKAGKESRPGKDRKPGKQDGDGKDGAGDAATDESDLTPERAAGLDELGKRLPGAGPRGARSSQDSDEDLFGEDYT